MDLTGKELYAMYAAEWTKQNTGVDSWEELERRERAVWDALAGKMAGWIASEHEK